MILFTLDVQEQKNIKFIALLIASMKTRCSVKWRTWWISHLRFTCSHLCAILLRDFLMENTKKILSANFQSKSEASLLTLWFYFALLNHVKIKKKLHNWYFALWGRTHNRLKQISKNVITRWSCTKIVLLTATRALLLERRWCWATACGTILGRSVWRWRWWYWSWW